MCVATVDDGCVPALRIGGGGCSKMMHGADRWIDGWFPKRWMLDAHDC